MMQIVLDGSARGKYISYAGVYGFPAAYGALSHAWKVMLARHKLTALHTTDAMRFDGEFAAKKEDWGNESAVKRDALLMEFANLKKLLDLGGLGFAIHIEGLSEKEVAARKRELFEKVVTDIIEKLPEDAGELHLVCDTEQDAADEFRRWLDRLKLRDPASRRIVVLCFASSKAIQAVQLADMCAYFLRDECERQDERPGEPVNPILDVLSKEGGLRVGFMRDGKDVERA